jgi:hypothetical protein
MKVELSVFATRMRMDRNAHVRPRPQNRKSDLTPFMDTDPRRRRDE